MKFVAPVAIAAFLASSQQVLAEDESEEPESEERIEEIVVYGGRTLVQLRLDIYRAEEDFFELFNTLNSDDEFDVYCGKKLKVGSNIRRWGCQANFAREIYADTTRNFRLGVVDTYAEAQISMKTRELRAEVLELVERHDNLKDALMRIPRAQQIYARERLRRCYKKLICW